MSYLLRPFPLAAKRSFPFSKAAWFQFRFLEASDFAALHQYCWPEKTQAELEDLLSRALKLSQQNRGGAIVALVEGQVSAFGMLTRWPQQGELSDLIVRQDLRSCGLGTALLHALTHFASNLNISTLEIGAFAWNVRAIALYQRLGFIEHHRLDIRIASKPETIIYFHKRIGEPESL